MAGPLKILVVETFLLGDLVYLGPLVSALRSRLPNTKIEVLASSATSGFPFFQRINIGVHHFDFPWSRIGWHKKPFLMFKAGFDFYKQFGQKFRDYAVLDPRGDFRHKLIACILRPSRFIQYRSGAKWPEAIRGASPRHIFISRQEFFHQFMLKCGLSEEEQLPWPWLSDFRSGCLHNTKKVLLAPESSNRLKYWKSENWILLSQLLRQRGWEVTLVVYSGDAVHENDLKVFIDIWSGSIVELTRLVSEARAVIAVDSFVGHLAASVGTPVVSLFGPTSAERWKPWGDNVVPITAPGYTCRPCLNKGCVQPEDNCMEAIQVEQVLQAFLDILSDRESYKRKQDTS